MVQLHEAISLPNTIKAALGVADDTQKAYHGPKASPRQMNVKMRIMDIWPHQEGSESQREACELGHHGRAQNHQDCGRLEDVLVAQLGDESVHGPQQNPAARYERYYTGDCLKMTRITAQTGANEVQGIRNLTFTRTDNDMASLLCSHGGIVRGTGSLAAQRGRLTC